MGKLGLVLSGGGAKGAYEIGVVIALKRLGKKFDIVTGTSIGALNGIFVASGDIRSALKLWKNISFNMIFDENSFTACSDDNIVSIYKEYAKSFINDGGMDVSKIENILCKYFNPKKFYNSNIDYGLVTYNLSKHKPKIISKKDLPNDIIKDYVIASASCYPAFKPKKINDDLYIDGGYYDNFPVSLAIELGADEIIGVDLKAVGFKREIFNKGIPVTVITPKNKIVSFLVFDKKQSREALKFGYNDTMKKFGKLDGDVFTFKKGNLVKNYNKYNIKVEKCIKDLFSNVDNSVITVFSNPIKEFFESKLSYKNFNKVVEYAGKVFDLKESTIYRVTTYNNILLDELYKTPISKDILNTSKKNIVRMFFENVNKKDLTGVLKFIPLFPYEFLVSVYIYAIKSNKIFY